LGRKSDARYIVSFSFDNSRVRQRRFGSRTLSEEVAFDRAKVTSVDWLSYPILDITEAPEAVDIVLINHPELPPAGAGESSIRPVAAAIANAVFDASGVRLRRAPLTPDRLKPALA
jgi:nicotinate dehydrogenase subunit B